MIVGLSFHKEPCGFGRWGHIRLWDYIRCTCWWWVGEKLNETEEDTDGSLFPPASSLSCYWPEFHICHTHMIGVNLAHFHSQDVAGQITLLCPVIWHVIMTPHQYNSNTDASVLDTYDIKVKVCIEWKTEYENKLIIIVDLLFPTSRGLCSLL